MPPVFTTLSIIIPVYNERRTVMQLLNAVAAQPIGNLHKEMVIVDDFSTDGTREFLQQMDLPSLFGKDGITVKVDPARGEQGQRGAAFAPPSRTAPANSCSCRMPTWNTIPATIPRC